MKGFLIPPKSTKSGKCKTYRQRQQLTSAQAGFFWRHQRVLAEFLKPKLVQARPCSLLPLSGGIATILGNRKVPGLLGIFGRSCQEAVGQLVRSLPCGTQGFPMHRPTPHRVETTHALGPRADTLSNRPEFFERVSARGPSA